MPTDPDHLEPESHHAPNAGELRGILRQIRDAQHQTNTHLKRIEKQMVDFTQVEADLKASIDAAVTALNGGLVQQLRDQLATQQAALDAAQAQGATDQATIADQLQQIADANTAAQGVVDDIEAEVSALNAATGSTPTPDAPPAAS